MIKQTLNHMRDNPWVLWTFSEILFFIMVSVMATFGVIIIVPALALKHYFLCILGGLAAIFGSTIVLYIMCGEGHSGW